MLKGKNKLILVVVLNIAIWSYFAYTFYTAYNSYDEPLETDNGQKIQTIELKDSVVYQLALNYKDPFLKEQTKIKNYKENGYGNTGAQPKEIKQVAAKTPTVTTIKPTLDIKYLGLVKNNNTGVATALININGQSHIVKTGDVVNGIQIKNIGSNSIDLIEGKNKLSIVKN